MDKYRSALTVAKYVTLLMVRYLKFICGELLMLKRMFVSESTANQCLHAVLDAKTRIVS